MDRMLIDYLPNSIARMREIQMIMTAEQPEFVALWQGSLNALNDQFVQSATAYGVARWEKILHIVPKERDNLEARKFRILTRLNEQRPYTVNALGGQLETLCGSDGYSLALPSDVFTLVVRVALTAKSNYEDVERLLRRVVPANIQIDLALKYNQHLTLSQFTYGRLSHYTHHELRNEVLSNG